MVDKLEKNFFPKNFFDKYKQEYHDFSFISEYNYFFICKFSSFIKTNKEYQLKWHQILNDDKILEKQIFILILKMPSEDIFDAIIHLCVNKERKKEFLDFLLKNEKNIDLSILIKDILNTINYCQFGDDLYFTFLNHYIDTFNVIDKYTKMLFNTKLILSEQNEKIDSIIKIYSPKISDFSSYIFTFKSIISKHHNFYNGLMEDFLPVKLDFEKNKKIFVYEHFVNSQQKISLLEFFNKCKDMYNLHVLYIIHSKLIKEKKIENFFSSKSIEKIKYYFLNTFSRKHNNYYIPEYQLNIISECLILFLKNDFFSIFNVLSVLENLYRNCYNYSHKETIENIIKNQSDLCKNKNISHIFLKNNQLINNDDFLYSFNIKNNFHHFQIPNIQYEQIISMFLFKFLINEYL